MRQKAPTKERNLPKASNEEENERASVKCGTSTGKMNQHNLDVNYFGITCTLQ